MHKFFIFLGAVLLIVVVIPALVVGIFPEGEQKPAINTEETGESPGIVTPTPSPSSPGPASPSPVFKNQPVAVYVKEINKVVKMDLEDYVMGVVAAEMPLSFELEALKAQAVVARTFAYRRVFLNIKNDEHPDAFLCTDSEHCQAWTDPEKLPGRTGNPADSQAAARYNKLKEAVESTRGIIITYDGKPIDAIYHSNSGGMTEDAAEVWAGRDVPYLKGVKSDGETDAAVYKTVYEIAYRDFYDILTKEYKDIKLDKNNIMNNIKNIVRSESGRIVKITLGNLELTGRDVRKIFNLRSTNMWFSDDKKGQKLIITTYGNGHGVGLSQYGANARALENMNYEEIIKYYYRNVDISKIMN